jgi:DDE family transposase/uncharacterized protein DUF4372
VRHQNSVFHELLKQIPWAEFDALVARHSADAGVRRLPTKTQFIALLYAQLAGTVSLRETVAGLRSHATRLYHLGARPVCRSTLADANALRPAAVFADLFARMVQSAHRGLRRAIGEATLLIDSTGLPLNARSDGWARFSAKACGAKLHVIYDPNAERPIYAAISAANVNDITAAHAMPIVAGATYVFDLGYYDYAWWAELDRAQCRIVTRIKCNTRLSVIEHLPLPVGSTILSDCIGFLPARQARNRHNPMQDAVREIRVLTETGKQLRILSNDLDASAQEIADLYKQRWQIELFFRWIKQTLKITRFLGTSENAIRIQVAVALIAFLLLRLAHARQRAVAGATAFARLVRANLMHRRHLDALLDGPIPPVQDPRQAQIHWADA